MYVTDFHRQVVPDVVEICTALHLDVQGMFRVILHDLSPCFILRGWEMLMQFNNNKRKGFFVTFMSSKYRLYFLILFVSSPQAGSSSITSKEMVLMQTQTQPNMISPECDRVEPVVSFKCGPFAADIRHPLPGCYKRCIYESAGKCQGAEANLARHRYNENFCRRMCNTGMGCMIQYQKPGFPPYPF